MKLTSSDAASFISTLQETVKLCWGMAITELLVR
ncbi:MAG: hypothetical protein AVDCRST_MAG93-771 [uncultured Chloroflexia bacterium]|uniref:Uncharacterized protein n=1 Tax=uncultured Chloroflexia bacterium TaxID=1672391 RepID=A0A6J4HQC3_9CHLR|nr:MAG: hypothetical protein AVDCRST_MAG93-771 [uncultured Chloroflexia bacterium]